MSEKLGISMGGSWQRMISGGAKSVVCLLDWDSG